MEMIFFSFKANAEQSKSQKTSEKSGLNPLFIYLFIVHSSSY